MRHYQQRVVGKFSCDLSRRRQQRDHHGILRDQRGQLSIQRPHRDRRRYPPRLQWWRFSPHDCRDAEPGVRGHAQQDGGGGRHKPLGVARGQLPSADRRESRHNLLLLRRWQRHKGRPIPHPHETGPGVGERTDRLRMEVRQSVYPPRKRHRAQRSVRGVGHDSADTLAADRQECV